MPEWTHCPYCGTKLDPADTACRNCGEAKPSASTVPSGEHGRPLGEAALADLTEELREALAPGLQLLKPLGQGGMGVVFLARDPALKRLAVVKVLLPALALDENARKRFEREAEAAAAVSHPNVVSVYQVGELPRSSTSYFVMQHVDGPTLAEEFPEGSAVAEGRAKRIIGEVASALASAHTRGLVHRDIKPGNIMLDRETDRAVVLDFGISAAVSPERRGQDTKLTAQGTSIGTPQYMSPEQAAGEEVTDRSDVYSLGLVAFELLTGRPPFQETSAMALIAAHINKEPPAVASLRPDIDPQLASLVNRCLVKEPTERPPAEDVARYLVPPSQPTVEWPPPGLQPLWGYGAALTRRAVAAVVVGLGFFTLLWLQPQVTTARWWAEETSWFWQVAYLGSWTERFFIDPVVCVMRKSVALTCLPFQAEATSLWMTGLLGLTAVGLTLSLLLARRSWRLMQMLRQARRWGYSEEILASVAWDEYADSGDLLNGAGRWALEPLSARSGVWRRRWLAVRWYWLGGLASATLPLLWLLGVLRLGGTHHVWLNGEELLLFVLPLLGAWFCRVRGARMRTVAVGGGTRPRLDPQATDHQRDLVFAWQHSIDPQWIDAPFPHARRVTVLSNLVPIALIAVCAALLFGVWGLSVLITPDARSAVQAWTDQLERRPSESWAAIDSSVADLLGAYQRFPSAPSDSLADLDPDSLLDAGEIQTAARVVRERLARARYFWHETDYVFYTRPLPEALAANARLAEMRGDSLMALESTLLIERYQDHGWIQWILLGTLSNGAVMLMSDPGVPLGERYVLREDVGPTRLRIALASVDGFCMNGRELLFGPARQRGALVERLVRELSASGARTRETIIADSLVLHDAAAQASVPGIPGLAGAIRRIRWCVEAGAWFR